MKDFKKDKYKDQIEEFERRVKEEEEALRRQYELKENDLIIMDQKGNIIDIREWRNDPLKRVVTIRYRQEKYYKMKYFLKWYSQARVMQAIDRIVPIIEGRAKLLHYLRQKPAVAFFKLLKLRNPEIYLPKLQRLFKLLIKASPFVFDPYKTFLERIILFNRVNLLNKLLSKVDDITNEYYLRLYLQKWRQNVEDIKEEKRKILLSFIKKKIKDEREINNNRKMELLKRILDRDNKRILNKFRQALKVWAFVAKVPFIIDNGEIKTIDGKKVTPENVQEITENNMLTSVFGQDVLDKMGENIISTPEQREKWLKEKLTNFINKLENKNKTLLRTKLYKWHTNANYTQIIEGVKAIQRFLRRKLGHKLQKKRKELVDKFIKKLVIRRILQVSKLNNLIQTLKRIYADKNILNKLSTLQKNKNQTEILKDIVNNTEDKLNKLKLKTYLNRWYNYSEGVYNKEQDAITLIQAVVKGFLMRKEINKIKRRKELLNKFINRKEHRNILKYALNKWDKNAMLVLCDESALKIQNAFRLFYARIKLDKLKNNSDYYKKLCQALSKISGQPKPFFDKLKNIQKVSKFNDLLKNLEQKKLDNIKDSFNKLKQNNKILALENIITNIDDKMYNKLKYYFDLWKKHVNKEQKIEEKLGNIFDKKEEKENLKLNLALKKWLYNAQMIKFDINKIRIGFFCKKILYKLTQKKIEKQAQNNWQKLTSKLLNDDTKLDIKDIIEQLKRHFGIKNMIKSIVENTRKNVIKKLLNDYLRNQWEQKMKEILDFTNENNKNNYLHTYLKKWKKANRNMKKKEKVLSKALDTLDFINKSKKINTINDVFLNKRIFDTVENAKKLIALRRLCKLAKEDKKNKDLKSGLINANKNLLDQHKRHLMDKIYKTYAYKVLDNLMNKLSEIQKKKSIEPKCDFMNNLNMIAINDKEYTYKNVKKIDKEPRIKNLRFKKQANEVTEQDLLENKSKNNMIALKAIIPELIEYINDIFRKRKSEAFSNIQTEARNKYLVKSMSNFVNKKYMPEKQKLMNNLKDIKRIQLTEGPLQVKLFSMLRKKIIYTMFDRDDVEELYRVLRVIKLFKITEINKELAEERWLRTLIRKWRFLAFSKSMSKKKLAYLYKHFHVNYLEMANNVFGEQDSNPSVIKEFERFGSNVGIWENEKPDYAERIKHSKSKKISYSTSTFKKLLKDKEEQKEKKKAKKIEEEIEEEDEKEDKKKKVDDDEENEEESENDDNNISDENNNKKDGK